MFESDIREEYFEWMFDLVCDERFSKAISYRKLLTRLHETEFTYIIPRDENRALDGIGLRHQFARVNGYYDLSDVLYGPCSVLEMLIALSIRCEESIMDDPSVGDRTGQWFWGMIVNLGLGSMVDSRFNDLLVNDAIDRFLNREYRPDGKGGLFTIENCDRDLREVEIWYQLCWYLDTIV